jgi:type IV secretory pathway VirB2 component (pilin)
MRFLLNPFASNHPLTPWTPQRETRRQWNVVIGLMALLICLMCFPEPAFAQTSLPWETFTQKLACTVTGPWVRWACVLAIAICGVLYGFAELQGPFKQVMMIGAGFSVALGAVSVVPTFLGGSALSCT